MSLTAKFDSERLKNSLFKSFFFEKRSIQGTKHASFKRPSILPPFPTRGSLRRRRNLTLVRSGGSRPSDTKGGGEGGLWASVWSKNKGSRVSPLGPSLDPPLVSNVYDLKQHRYPCSEPPTDSTNYRKCISNFSFHLDWQINNGLFNNNRPKL